MPLTLVFAGSAEDGAVLEQALASAMTDTRIHVAIDAYHAIELAQRIRPQAMVIDPAVPGLTPIELLSRLKETVPGSPVLCWTARPDVDEASELLRAGAGAYLLKHDGPADLLDTCSGQSCLHRARSRGPRPAVVEDLERLNRSPLEVRGELAANRLDFW